MAVANYHYEFGSYPPAYIADEDGVPMHSWRVLVLPYIEDEQALYDQYDFSEPWNGPNNRRLAEQLVHHPFFCPTDNTRQPGMTSYVAVVGQQTMWPGAASTSEADIVDGVDNTLMLVEVIDSGIHWMEPRDFAYDDVIAAAQGGNQPGLGSKHERGAYVTFADSHAEYLLEGSVTPAQLKAMLTINGGEIISD